MPYTKLLNSLLKLKVKKPRDQQKKEETMFVDPSIMNRDAAPLDFKQRLTKIFRDRCKYFSFDTDMVITCA